MAENEAPERVQISNGSGSWQTYGAWKHRDADGPNVVVKYVRADLAPDAPCKLGEPLMHGPQPYRWCATHNRLLLTCESAAPDAAQDDLWSDLEVVVECIDIPLPQKDSIVAAIRRTQVKFADDVCQAQRDTWKEARQAVMEVSGFHRFGHFTVKLKDVVAALGAAALRAEGKGESL